MRRANARLEAKRRSPGVLRRMYKVVKHTITSAGCIGLSSTSYDVVPVASSSTSVDSKASVEDKTLQRKNRRVHFADGVRDLDTSMIIIELDKLVL